MSQNEHASPDSDSDSQGETTPAAILEPSVAAGVADALSGDVVTSAGAISFTTDTTAVKLPVDEANEQLNNQLVFITSDGNMSSKDSQGRSVTLEQILDLIAAHEALTIAHNGLLTDHEALKKAIIGNNQVFTQMTMNFNHLVLRVNAIDPTRDMYKVTITTIEPTVENPDKEGLIQASLLSDSHPKYPGMAQALTFVKADETTEAHWDPCDIPLPLSQFLGAMFKHYHAPVGEWYWVKLDRVPRVIGTMGDYVLTAYLPEKAGEPVVAVEEPAPVLRGDEAAANEASAA